MIRIKFNSGFVYLFLEVQPFLQILLLFHLKFCLNPINERVLGFQLRWLIGTYQP